MDSSGNLTLLKDKETLASTFLPSLRSSLPSLDPLILAFLASCSFPSTSPSVIHSSLSCLIFLPPSLGFTTSHFFSFRAFLPPCHRPFSFVLLPPLFLCFFLLPNPYRDSKSANLLFAYPVYVNYIEQEWEMDGHFSAHLVFKYNRPFSQHASVPEQVPR